MSKILEFFAGIADVVNEIFDMFGKMFDMLKMVGTLFKNIGDTLGIAIKILPPSLWWAMMAMVTIITVVAVMKYAGLGGSVDD